MVEIRLTDTLLRNMMTFRKLTNVQAKDCIVGENKIVFVINKGELGKAIGKGGKNIEKLKRHFQMAVDLVEYSPDPKEFIKKIFHDYRTGEAKIEEKNGKKVLILKVNKVDKGFIIGKNGRNLKIAKMLMRRYTDVDDVLIN